MSGRFPEKVRRYLRENKHFWLVLYVPVYLIMFFAVESHVTTDYWVSYMPLDDLIPFVEVFVIPYSLWYPLLFATGIYLLVRDADNFKKYMCFIIVGLTLSLLICAVFPNGQDLRPETFERDNIFTRLVAAIYSADTNTNVLPSMHVVGAVAAVSALCFTDTVKLRTKIGSAVLALLITAGTVFIKQHSFLDIIAAVVLCVPLFFAIYGRTISARRRRRIENKAEA